MIKIKYLETLEDVYDITVEDNHNFFANGILVHNCVEIALRPYQFCNLCEINTSTVESQGDLNERARAAAFIGTLQASYTDFHYLRPVWKRTTEKDGLIGVSGTGIASKKFLQCDTTQAAREVVLENKRVAKLINIRPAARTTCIKPSGTTSLVLGTSSGIHGWHSEHYLRRIRVGKNESIYTYLLVNHPELLEDDYFRPHDTAIICIPQKSPRNAIMRSEHPLDLLDRIKTVHDKWILPGHLDGQNTHNVSATVYIKPDEWESVGEWMWENRECYNGLSVLPYDGGSYIQAPFEDISAEKFSELFSNLHQINLDDVVEFDDNTDLSGEAACSGNQCEII